MAKLERQSSRAAAAVAEDEFDQIFRPHAVDRPRPLPAAAADGPLRGYGEGQDEDLLPLRRRRAPVRPSRIPAGRIGRILLLAGMLAAIALVVWAAWAVDRFFMTDARFRIDSSASIQVTGNSQVTRPELLSVFGSDLGRNIFHVPLRARQRELEQQLPWVEHATVMRLLPDQIRVAVLERTPVGFVRQGSGIGLIDGSGVLLEMPPATMAARHYSFPVVTGVTAQQAADQRAARMALYRQFMGAVGPAAAAQISEVDLSDPEDVRVLLPAAGSDLLVHFGGEEFAARWKMLEQRLPGWRARYPRLAGVDLRYQRQTVLQMAPEPPAPAPAGQAGESAHAASHGTRGRVQHARQPRRAASGARR